MAFVSCTKLDTDLATKQDKITFEAGSFLYFNSSGQLAINPALFCAYIAANCGGVTPTYCPTQPLLDGGFGYLAADPKDPAATVEIAPCDGSEPSIWIYPTSGVGHTVPVLDCSSSVIGYGADASSCAVPLVSC